MNINPAWEVASIATMYSEVFRNVCFGVLCAALIVFIWAYLSKGK